MDGIKIKQTNEMNGSFESERKVSKKDGCLFGELF